MIMNTFNHTNDIASGEHVLNAEAITREVLGYCDRALTGSSFFSGLANGTVSCEEAAYAFGQFYHWRNQFHTWFGYAIARSGDCSSMVRKKALASLAEHILIEMRDNHDVLYLDFLEEFGLPNAGEAKARHATQAYGASFTQRFGNHDDPLFHMVAAISARELLASRRNEFVINRYFEQNGIVPHLWWELHRELEAEHFQTEMETVLEACFESGSDFDTYRREMVASIEAHIEYWDNLLAEARSQQPEALSQAA
jgi:hypothetical protein